MEVLKIKHWIRIYKPIVQPMIEVRGCINNNMSDTELDYCIKKLEGVAQALTDISRSISDQDVDMLKKKSSPIVSILPEIKTEDPLYDSLITYFNYISERGGKIIKLLLDRNPFEACQSQEPS